MDKSVQRMANKSHNYMNPKARTVHSLRACSIEVLAGDVKADRQIVLRRGCTLDYSEYCI